MRERERKEEREKQKERERKRERKENNLAIHKSVSYTKRSWIYGSKNCHNKI